jgi:YidC/Oxa1 family membrane protein insertase
VSLWNEVVELLREGIFAYAQASHGNLGAGIVGVTFLVRMALLPLGIHVARRTSAHQGRVKKIQPELDALKTRFKADRARLAEETRKVFAREQIPMLPLAGLIGGIVQVPVFIALYSAVRAATSAGGRFLWIANIAAPDRLVAVVVSGIAVLAALVAPQQAGQNRTVMTLLPAMLTMFLLWKMAAGVGLYWGVSTAVGAGQSLWLRRRPHK